MYALIYRFHSTGRRLRAWFILSMAIVLLMMALVPVAAQESSPAGNQVDGYPVVLDANTLFLVKQGIPGVASAEERAKIINNRLIQVANNDAIAPNAIRVEEVGSESVILAGDTLLFTVRDIDRLADLSRPATAARNVQIVQSAVTQYRHDHSIQKTTEGILFAVLSTTALIGFLVLLQWLISRLLTRIRAARRANVLDFRIQNFQIFGSDATSYLLSGCVRLLRLVLVIGAFYLYIPFVLSQFPATQAIGKSIFKDIAYRVNQSVTAGVQYLPNLVVIIIIAIFTHYVIQFAKLVITELGRGDAYTWFYPEWIRPTQRLVTMLIVAIACIVAAPYLPGFNSPAFQGISLFLGALFTLGSSSAVANAIAGIILIYTRAFQNGDVIRIGETIGEVLEKSLFVTRLLTFKKEVITIPNASVLNSNVVNFNAVSRESKTHLVLHTTITLGYDLSWRKVHEVLIEAAKATLGIVSDPYPFVLQTALNDYNVSYELNAYCDRPELMPAIYSELHQNIQDYCNQAGIEILSPAYSSIRDGNHSTIPSDYLPADYTPPTFQIQTPNNHRGMS